MAGKRHSLRQSARIVLATGWSDFMLKYRGSVLGYLWSFAGPLCQFFIILHVFRPVFGGEIPYYPFYLFLGIIVWEHFSLTTMSCIDLPRRKIQIMNRVRVPPVLFVLGVGWTHALIFLTRFALFVALCVLWGPPPPAAMLWYAPLMILQMSLLSLGIGAGIAAFSLRFRDVPHLWSVVLQVLFWLTPIMYAPMRSGTLVEEVLRMASGGAALSTLLTTFIAVQPLSVLVYDARRVFVLAGAGVPSLPHAALFTALCAGIFAGGAALYARRSRYFLQEF